MSFFKLSTGQTAQSDGNFESGGGNLDPIPEGTKLRTIITEAKWAEYQGDRYINLRHDVADGEYKKRVIFQKIRVCETDTKKRDKASCGWIRLRVPLLPEATKKLRRSWPASPMKVNFGNASCRRTPTWSCHRLTRIGNFRPRKKKHCESGLNKVRPIKATGRSSP